MKKLLVGFMAMALFSGVVTVEAKQYYWGGGETQQIGNGPITEVGPKKRKVTKQEYFELRENQAKEAKAVFKKQREERDGLGGGPGCRFCE